MRKEVKPVLSKNNGKPESLTHNPDESVQNPFPTPNGSLRERTLPSARVLELVEPSQSRNGSLRERSPPGVHVQEIAEPSQTLDELRQLTVELNRRLGLMGHGGGPANGFYPAQPAEQGMPSAVRPNSNPFPMAQRSGPTDERFFHRPVDEGTPSVVRPVHDPNVHFQISSGNAYGQAYRRDHGLYPDETPVVYPHVTETPEIYYPARADKEWEVLLSGPRPTPSHVQECSRQEVRRYQENDQPPLGRVELAPLEPIYRYVQWAPEGVTEQPSSRVPLDSFPTQKRMPEKGTTESITGQMGQTPHSSFGFVSLPETDAR